MKKIIRLFLILFCIFFVLRAMPGSFVPAMRRAVRRSGRLAGEATLRIAEAIDGFSGPAAEASSQEPDPAADEQDPGSPDREDRDTEPVPDDKADPGTDPETDSGTASGADPGADPEKAKKTDSEKDTAQGETDSGEKTDNADRSPEEGQDGEQTERDAGTDAEDGIFYYYYTRISKEERLLYDAMLSLATDPEAEDDTEESRLLSMNPSSEEFAESYTRAYNALVTDHPELFWVAQARVRYSCRYYVLPAFGGKYKVFLSLTENTGAAGDSGSGDGAASGDRGDKEGVFRAAYKKEQEELEAAADALLDQVDMTRSEAGIALQLHDLLIDKAWYNIEAGADDYAHTAYGALVEDSAGNPGGALCDGYALAYEYLLQRAGLTCTMVCGYAGASEEDNEKHAWNLVRLDDDWYEVDATWDDLDFLLSPSDKGYDLLLEALSDEDYMSRIRHYMFNRTTDEMRSFTPGDEFTYTSYNGWVTLLQPSVHIRFTSEESSQTRDFVTPLAPEAEGTWYTWEMLTGHD